MEYVAGGNVAVQPLRREAEGEAPSSREHPVAQVFRYTALQNVLSDLVQAARIAIICQKPHCVNRHRARAFSMPVAHTHLPEELWSPPKVLLNAPRQICYVRRR